MNANRNRRQPRGTVAVYRPRHQISGALGAALYRFVAGQVVLRRPGQWDARWLTWAPEAPPLVDQSRVQAPRTTWARRPGYHRQLVRLAGLTAVAGYYTARTITVAVLVLIALTALTRIVARAHRRHVYEPVIGTWWQYVAEKTGATGDPLTWITFVTHQIRWEPVTPLAAATRPRTAAASPDLDGELHTAEDPAGTATEAPRTRQDKGGWLTRLAPPVAAFLRPLACPIEEREWVLRTRGRFVADRRVRAAVVARTLEALVRVVQRSRTVRACPRVVRHDLAGDDARIEIHYPSTYPAHPQDIAEIQRVLRDRLPARAPDPDAAPDTDDDTDDDEDTDEAALPVGAWTARCDHRNLRIVFTRSRLLPADVPMTRATFDQYPLHIVPIGVELTRRGQARQVTIPLKAKTPHVSVSASTGWGKTTTANVMAAHLLYHGGYGIVLDPKEIGYVDAFRGASPYVELRTSVGGWVEAISRVLTEMNRRYTLMNECADRIAALGLPKMHEHAELYFQQLFMLEDEKGSLTTAIHMWWKACGGPDGKPGKGDPEPFSHQQQILWRGRAAAVHIFTLAQQNNARVFLNTDMRDQYMFRILAGPQNRQSWDMTFPGTRKRSIPKKKGRAVYGIGPGGIRTIQLGHITDTEARECAIHGIGVADRQNEARAHLLAQATGRPVWEVSPLPYWVTPPGQSTRGVPGQRPRPDTSAPRAERPLSLVKPADTAELDPTADDKGHLDETTKTSVNGFTSTRGNDTTDGIKDVAGLVVGEAAGAEFLGITLAAFEQRRKRAKRGECPSINGETRVGRRPAWTTLELTEWHNLFRSKNQ